MQAHGFIVSCMEHESREMQFLKLFLTGAACMHLFALNYIVHFVPMTFSEFMAHAWWEPWPEDLPPAIARALTQGIEDGHSCSCHLLPGLLRFSLYCMDLFLKTKSGFVQRSEFHVHKQNSQKQHTRARCHMVLSNRGTWVTS